MIELRLLRYFLAVAREASITRAAATLHISQPSLSKQMMELEAALGQKLLLRGKKKVTLTEEGALLRRRAEEILTLMKKTEAELTAGSALISGELRLAGAGSESVARAAASLLAKYSGVSFQFFNGDAEKIEDGLLHGALDFGILLEPVDLEKYEHIPLKEHASWGFLMPSDALLAAKDAITPEDIKTLPLILPQRRGLRRKLSTWSGLAPEEMNIVASFDILQNYPLLLLKGGLGCAFALSTLIDTGKSLCFRPLEPPLTSRYGLAWKRGAALSRAAEKFIEEVRLAQST